MKIFKPILFFILLILYSISYSQNSQNSQNSQKFVVGLCYDKKGGNLLQQYHCYFNFLPDISNWWMDPDKPIPTTGFLMSPSCGKDIDIYDQAGTTLDMDCFKKNGSKKGYVELW